MTRWTTENEVKFLRDCALGSLFGIVEIGVMDGDTTRELLKASSPVLAVYGIDPIIKDSMSDAIGSVESILGLEKEFPGRFVFIQDYSWNVARWFDMPVDFIFVDGSHLYEDVKRDFELWYPKLPEKGIICFHDSAPTESGATFEGWPGPTQLCNELEEQGVQRSARVDTIRAYIR